MRGAGSRFGYRNRGGQGRDQLGLAHERGRIDRRAGIGDFERSRRRRLRNRGAQFYDHALRIGKPEGVELNRLRQVQHNARHARLGFYEANLFEPRVANRDERVFGLDFRQQALDVEQDSVGVTQPARGVVNIGGNIDRDTGDFTQR